MDSYFVVSLYVGNRLTNSFGPYLNLEQAAIVADNHAYNWTQLVSFMLAVEEVYYHEGNVVVLGTKYEVKV